MHRVNSSEYRDLLASALSPVENAMKSETNNGVAKISFPSSEGGKMAPGLAIQTADWLFTFCFDTPPWKYIMIQAERHSLIPKDHIAVPPSNKSATEKVAAVQQVLFSNDRVPGIEQFKVQDATSGELLLTGFYLPVYDGTSSEKGFFTNNERLAFTSLTIDKNGLIEINNSSLLENGELPFDDKVARNDYVIRTRRPPSCGTWQNPLRETKEERLRNLRQTYGRKFGS